MVKIKQPFVRMKQRFRKMKRAFVRPICNIRNFSLHTNIVKERFVNPKKSITFANSQSKVW
ncbi:MAG: hypothetical protein LBL74_07775 [Bacteroidales bacterium]|nr:hypothetical protein [Bacteroidales bacterium]